MSIVATADNITDMTLNETTVSEQQTSSSTHEMDSTTLFMRDAYTAWISPIQYSRSLLELSSNEYTVDENELNFRNSIYSKVFPGTAINPNLTKHEIIIEKYLKNSRNIIPYPAQMDNAYRELKSQLKDFPVPPQNDILPILYSHALFASDTVRRICEDVIAQKQQQRAQQTKWWTTADLSVAADDDACIASTSGDNSCIATVGEFNSFLEMHPYKKKTEKRIARELTLKNLLKDYYFTKEGQKNKLEITSDQHLAYMKFIEAKLYSRKNKQNIDKISEDELMSVYEKYFSRFFSSQKLQTVALIGSSDSLFIDSLYLVLLQTNHLDGPDRLSKKKNIISSLPWILSRSDNLPDTIVSAIDSLRSQEFCLQHNPFGHFIFRIVANERKLEIRPEEARPKLIYLATEEKKRSNGKPDSIRAKNYYSSHQDKFKTPDTLHVKTWLIPANTDEPCSECLQKDTTFFNSISTNSYNLPPEVESYLLAGFKNNKNDNFIGPFQSRFGTWYFQIKNYRNGGIILPFDSVKSQVYDDLLINDLPFDSIMKTKTGQNLINREMYTKALFEHFTEEIDSIPTNEIKKFIRKNSDETKKNNRIWERTIHNARQTLRSEKVEQSLQNSLEWIKSLSINKDLLYMDCSK